MKNEYTSKELEKIAIARFVIDAKDYQAMALLLKSLSTFFEGRLYYNSILANKSDPFPNGCHCYAYLISEDDVE